MLATEATEVRGVDGGGPVEEAGATAREPPLVVDLDGTLIRSDLLVESYLSLLGADPRAAVAALGALRDGKAAFKARIADAATVDVATLPFDEDVLALVRAARAAGRETHLASASDHRYVEAVAAHLGLFDGAEGSRDGRNLSGREKADMLAGRFGERGFDYVGDAAVDAAVWSRARTAYAVAPSARLKRRLAREDLTVQPVGASRGAARALLKAMRPHQWLKNLLVFAPLAAGHDFALLAGVRALAAFVAFSLVASSVYLLNDLLDLRSDREHARKRLRPFASGRAPLLPGALLAPVLLLAGAAVSAFLPWRFGAALAGYYVLTLAYSFQLKRVMTVDVIALACLYGARLVAGGYATDTPLSPWLEALAVFLFLSLALVKRAGELADRIASGRGDPAGRGYRLGDLPMVEGMAAAAGYVAVLVLALYFNSAAVGALYAKPHRLWLICVVVLYWVSRMLMKAHRGEMHDDPLVFATRDPASQVCGVIAAGALVAASL